MSNFCSKCGSPVDPSARFCVKCGAQLKVSAVTEPVAEVTEAIQNTEAAQVIETPTATQAAELAETSVAEAADVDVAAEPAAEAVEEAAEVPVAEAVEAAEEPIVEEAAEAPAEKDVVEEVAEAAETPVTEAPVAEAADVAVEPETQAAEETAEIVQDGASYAATETAAEVVPVDIKVEPAVTAEIQTPQAEPKKKNILKIIIPIAAVVVAAVVVVIIVMANQKKKYEEAQELYNEGSYEQAAEAFEALGSYQDSADMVKKSTYEGAYAYYRQKDYQKALDMFNGLGEYEDSAAMAEKSQKGLKYVEAVKFYEAGDEESIQKALSLFTEAEGFSDSADMAAKCENELAQIQKEKAFAAAMELYEAAGDDDEKLQEASDAFAAIFDSEEAYEMMAEIDSKIIIHKAQKLADEGDWEGALEQLGNYTRGSDDEYNKLYKECYNNSEYEKGVAALEAGNNEEAFNIFAGLGDFKDSADLAASCIPDLPSSGEIYHNSSYSRQSSKLVIDNSGFKNTYIKIYCGNDLVSSMFIRENESAGIWLPSGTYSMKQAYGDTWYGEDEMFGTDGKYWKCTFGGSETFEIEANYLYTISTDNGSGTGVGNTATDPSSF